MEQNKLAADIVNNTNGLSSHTLGRTHSYTHSLTAADNSFGGLALTCTVTFCTDAHLQKRLMGLILKAC